MTSARDDTTHSTPTLPARGLQLRVVTTQGTHLLPLPGRGAVEIGRSEDADVRIDDRSVSRRHATLHLGERIGSKTTGAPMAHVCAARR